MWLRLVLVLRLCNGMLLIPDPFRCRTTRESYWRVFGMNRALADKMIRLLFAATTVLQGIIAFKSRSANTNVKTVEDPPMSAANHPIADNFEQVNMS
jgi:hypothetical protein